MLKMTQVKLELISNVAMYYFVEEAIRGRTSNICKRYREVNKKYMKNYDPTKNSKYIMYLDANSLYGWATSQYLLHGGFKWIKNVDNFNINSISENSPICYILKVDIEHPDELHNDYPLAPKKLEITYGMLSNYCKNIADNYGIKISDFKKLLLNLAIKLIMQFRFFLHHYFCDYIIRIFISCFRNLIYLNATSDGCCTEFNVFYFVFYYFITL